MKPNQTDNNDGHDTPNGEGGGTSFPALFSRDEFVERVGSLLPGQSIVYHVGNLAVDRCDAAVAAVADAARTLGFPTDCLVQVYDYAESDRAAREYFGLGVGSLTQARLPNDPAGDTGVCLYIFTKN